MAGARDIDRIRPMGLRVLQRLDGCADAGEFTFSCAIDPKRARLRRRSYEQQ